MRLFRDFLLKRQDLADGLAAVFGGQVGAQRVEFSGQGLQCGEIRQKFRAFQSRVERGEIPFLVHNVSSL